MQRVSGLVTTSATRLTVMINEIVVVVALAITITNIALKKSFLPY
jgi:hypothetical protein